MDLWDGGQRKAYYPETDVENPSVADWLDDTAIVEALDEETEGKTTPCTDAIAGSLPKKDGDAASCCSGDNAGKYEHATQSLGRRIYSGQNSIANDENTASERKSVEANEEKRSPSVFVTPKGGRQAREDENSAQDGKGGVDACVKDNWGRGGRS